MSLATVAPGDPSQQITVLVQAVVKDLINTMVDRFGQFSMNRKLGRQALVLNVEGT
ncbi:hypothetical protein BYT27DRAFT_7204678 [Phlegmacium glaucopus]|nr:hypothetical protein BYT27DRAFT_7204678 [Phlegmacium glaucopus]